MRKSHIDDAECSFLPFSNEKQIEKNSSLQVFNINQILSYNMYFCFLWNICFFKTLYYKMYLLNFLILSEEENKEYQNKHIKGFVIVLKSIMKYILLFMFDFTETTKINYKEKNIKCDSKHRSVFK